MRGSLAAFLLLCCAVGACGDDDVAKPIGDAADGLPWHEAFSSISAADADKTLVLMVITNDDPLLSEQSGGAQPKAGAGLNAGAGPNVGAGVADQLWCRDVFSRAVRHAFASRPDLVDRVSLQALAAGMPAALTGGKLRNQPARGIVAVCDGGYRLLAFTVGIPDADLLLTLIEDAQDVRSLDKIQQPQERVTSIAQRSGERVSRMWIGVLNEMLLSLGGDDDERDDRPDDVEAGADADVEQKQIDRLAFLSESYLPTYLADVKYRFGLTAASDRTRLLILEQHPQARDPWCQSMIPFLAGGDFLTLWRPLCASVWGFQPIVPDPDGPPWLDWWDTNTKAGAVVLSLEPPQTSRRAPWPPAGSVGKKSSRAIGWQEAHELAMQLSFRSVDSQQLFDLMRSRDIESVDIQIPTRARYLIFDPKKKLPIVIREGDPPGRFAGRLKRVQ